MSRVATSAPSALGQISLPQVSLRALKIGGAATLGLVGAVYVVYRTVRAFRNLNAELATRTQERDARPTVEAHAAVTATRDAAVAAQGVAEAALAAHTRELEAAVAARGIAEGALATAEAALAARTLDLEAAQAAAAARTAVPDSDLARARQAEDALATARGEHATALTTAQATARAAQERAQRAEAQVAGLQAEVAGLKHRVAEEKAARDWSNAAFAQAFRQSHSGFWPAGFSTVPFRASL